MEIFDSLKKKYDGKTIQKIEAECGTIKDAAIMARRDFIYGLYYLERTNRFKENESYKKATFGEYLYGVFGMTAVRYERERRAFISFPDEAVRIGVGRVIKAIDTCGQLKAVKAIREIDDGKILEPQKANKIIEKYAPKKKKEVKRVTVTELQAQIAEKNKIIADQNKTIKEQAEQITKLKAALEQKNKMIHIFEPVMPFIQTNGIDGKLHA